LSKSDGIALPAHDLSENGITFDSFLQAQPTNPEGILNRIFKGLTVIGCWALFTVSFIAEGNLIANLFGDAYAASQNERNNSNQRRLG
jgi:hypothetical protein